MTCGNEKAYTTFTGKSYCDGWSGISLEECQAKCSKNEVPNANCPRRGVKCKYVHYNRPSKWCHLADDTCNPVKGANKYTLTEKGGQYIHSYLHFKIAFLKHTSFDVQLQGK